MAEATDQSVRVLHRARLRVDSGPLARPMARRLIGALAVTVPLGVDRLEEACQIGEAIVDACTAIGDTPELSVVLAPGELTIRVGPLAGGGAARLLRADRGGTIGRLATSTSVRDGHSGETVLITVS